MEGVFQNEKAKDNERRLFQRLGLQEACQILHGGLSQPVCLRHDHFILHNQETVQEIWHLGLPLDPQFGLWRSELPLF